MVIAGVVIGVGGVRPARPLPRGEAARPRVGVLGAEAVGIRLVRQPAARAVVIPRRHGGPRAAGGVRPGGHRFHAARVVSRVCHRIRPRASGFLKFAGQEVIVRNSLTSLF